MLSPTVGLYLRCVLWGLATGAVAGAGGGVALGLYPATIENFGLVLILPFAFYGTLVGVVVSVVPAVLGGLVVIGVVLPRHPYPSSADAVKRDLGVAFFAFVGVLNGGFLLAVAAGGNGVSSIAESLPFLGGTDTCVAVMLWWAATSITRAWPIA